MNNKKAFTLIELLVVIAIIALLMSILMPALAKVKKQALAVACQARLKQWGVIFAQYTDENNGFFHQRQIGTDEGYLRMWHRTYEPFYKDREMLCCPAAKNPARTTGPFGCWNADLGSWDPCDYYGSYGISRWVVDMQDGMAQNPGFWRRADVKGAEKIPVVTDCQYVTFFASSGGAPPEWDGDYRSPEMNWITINRHLGGINVLFMDWSVRKVGLKELRTLEWSREYDTCDIYTVCGQNGNVKACADLWISAGGVWMKKFPVY